MRKTPILLLALYCLVSTTRAQTTDSSINAIEGLPSSYFGHVENKASKIESDLTRKSDKYLSRLARHEQKIRSALFKIDSNAARAYFDLAGEKYLELESKMKSAEGLLNKSIGGEYLPYLDSMKGALSFLQDKEMSAVTKVDPSKLSDAFKQVSQLEAKLQNAQEIKQFIAQRKEQLKELITRYTTLPAAIKSQIEKYNKEFYYYSQQLREYREMLNDPDKMEKKALELLSKTNAFKQFMREHSYLSGLINIPDNYGTPQGIVGLQTRDLVSQQMRDRIAAGGSSGQQAFAQNMAAAQSQLNQLKDKITKLGGGPGDLDIPDYSKNPMKTKSFFKRLEFGMNLQTTRANYFFPTTSDLGLSIGYKLNSKSVIGIGGSYKMGLGEGIQHVSFSSEGASIRSFADMKLKWIFR